MEDQLAQVWETEHNGLCFEVKHKILHIPETVYLDAVGNFHDPYSEAAAQHFTESYLEWKNDQGVIGMVRIYHPEDKQHAPQVVLEAAVRYVVDCTDD